MANQYFQTGLAASSSGADGFVTSPLIVTGSVYWVDSQTGSDSNSGRETSPFATLAHAISTATTLNGDIIMIKSGHVEVLTSAIAISKSLRIYGLGFGSSAPSFTVNAAVDGIQVTAADTELNNLYFPVGTTIANTSRVKMDAARVTLKNLSFQCGANDTNTILVSANALYGRIESCGLTVAASGPAAGILVQSAAAVGLRVVSSSIDGGSYGFTNGGIYSTFAHTSFAYDTVTLTNKASIVHTAASKGYLTNLASGADCKVSI